MALSIKKEDRPFIGVFCLLFVAALALYARTLMPGVNGGDIGELQFLSYRLGLAHSTGYPLQLLLGRLWITLFPFGSVAMRINLLSAVFGAAAAAVTGLLAGRLTGNALAGLLAGLALTLGRLFWELAVDGDKYALNALFAALVLWLAWRWVERPTLGRLLWLAAVYGLSLTHHRSMLLMGPLLAVFVLVNQRGLLRRPRELALAIVVGLLPLSLYLYLPWAEARGLPPGQWNPQGFTGWIQWFMDAGFTSQVYLSPLTLTQLRDYALPAQLGELGWGLFLLGLVGVVTAFRHRRAFAALLLAAYVVWMVMTASYNIYEGTPRQWVHFLPYFVIAAVWCGVGAAALADLAARLARRTPLARFAGPTLAALLLLLPGWRLFEVYPTMRALSRDTTRLDAWRQILKFGYQGQRLGLLSLSRLAPNPVVVGDWEQVTVLWYFQQVEGYRPDMTVIYPVERLGEALAMGRPVYLSRTLAGISDRYPLTMAGPLIALLPAPDKTVPPDAISSNLVFSDTLELAAYRYESDIPARGGILPVTFYWRALKQPDADYSVGLRLLDGDGNEIWKEDSQHPVLGSYPTHLWSPGQVVADYYEVPLDRTLPAGTYRIGVILYSRTADGGFVNLRVGNADRAELPDFAMNK